MNIKLALLAAAFSVLAAMPAAASPSPATFGVIDLNAIMQTSDAAKGILSALEGKRKEFQAQILKEEDALRAAGQQFEKEKATLDKDKLEARRRALDERLFNGQKMVQERKAVLDRAFNDSMLRLKKEAAKIVAEIAKERNLSAVLTQEAVILSVPELDLTDEVIKRLNAKVKKIPVEWTEVKKGKKAG